MFDIWLRRKPYSSLTLKTITPHAGPFKTSRFVGFFANINKYAAKMRSYTHCYHPILKILELLFKRRGRCLFNVWIIYFYMRITEFATASIRLILGFKSGWWMSRRLLQLKSLTLLTQMISLPAPIFSLASWLKLPWLVWLSRPSAVVSSPFHSVW